MSIDYGDGNDSVVTFGEGSGTEIGSVSDIKLSLGGKDIDVTTFGDTYETTLPGLSTASCSLTVVGLPASLLARGDTGDLSVTFGTGTPLTIANCIVKKVDVSHKSGDKITVTYEIGPTKA